METVAWWSQPFYPDSAGASMAVHELHVLHRAGEAQLLQSRGAPVLVQRSVIQKNSRERFHQLVQSEIVYKLTQLPPLGIRMLSGFPTMGN